MIANQPLSTAGGFLSAFVRRSKPGVATQPVLEAPIRRPHGPFHFQFTASEGADYEVQAANDLKTWMPLARGKFTGGKMDYVDSEATKYSHRFYRVLSGALRSQEVLGYATVSVPPRFSMIANPLSAASNTVGSLLPKMANGTYLSRFDPAQSKLSKNSYDNGEWTLPHEILKPGEGAIIFNPTNEFKTLDFVGAALHGHVLNPIPAGFSIRSSQIPLPGRLDTELEFPLKDGDTVHVFDRDRQEYIVYDYPSAGWSRNPPVLAVGEAFWVGKNSPGNWARHFPID